MKTMTVVTYADATACFVPRLAAPARLIQGRGVSVVGAGKRDWRLRDGSTTATEHDSAMAAFPV